MAHKKGSYVLSSSGLTGGIYYLAKSSGFPESDLDYNDAIAIRLIVMIKELTWDSELIKRKIGRLTIDAENLSSLGKALKHAESRGFSISPL